MKASSNWPGARARGTAGRRGGPQRTGHAPGLPPPMAQPTPPAPPRRPAHRAGGPVRRPVVAARAASTLVRARGVKAQCGASSTLQARAAALPGAHRPCAPAKAAARSAGRCSRGGATHHLGPTPALPALPSQPTTPGRGPQADTIRKTVADNKVVVYSKTTCPYCSRVKGLMGDLKVPALVFELDQIGERLAARFGGGGGPRKCVPQTTRLAAAAPAPPAARPPTPFLARAADGPEIQATLGEVVGRKTVPQVFIGGKHVGGCDGELERVPAPPWPPPSPAHPPPAACRPRAPPCFAPSLPPPTPQTRWRPTRQASSRRCWRAWATISKAPTGPVPLGPPPDP
jgi:glutaredoxin 3